MAAKGRTGKDTARASNGAFTAEELAAMREHAQEQRAGARRGAPVARADGESAVLAKIGAMAATDRAIGLRLHEIIQVHAPSLAPKLWYGMPAYADGEGRVVCFFQDAGKFKTRYATLGFSDKAQLDDGVLWPTAFAVQALTPAAEEKIGALVRRAVRGVVVG